VVTWVEAPAQGGVMQRCQSSSRPLLVPNGEVLMSTPAVDELVDFVKRIDVIVVRIQLQIYTVIFTLDIQ
jgi:hypothetical protein